MVTLRRSLLALGAVAGVLVGCAGSPKPTAQPQVGFDTDPSVFQGVYETTANLRYATNKVSVSADGSLLAMGKGDGLHPVQLWDVERGEPLATLGRGLYEDEVALTPDGKLVAAALENEVPVWDVASKRKLYGLSPRSPTCKECYSNVLTASPDSTTLAVLITGAKTQVGLFDLATGRRTQTWSLPEPVAKGAMRVMTSPGMRNYLAMRFSPDGTRLTVIRDPYNAYTLQVRVWSVPDGKIIGDYQLDTPIPIHFDAHMWVDGSPVLGVFTEQGMDLVRVDTGEVIQSLADFPDQKEYAGHKNVVELYASPDNRLMLGYYETYVESLDENVGGMALWDLKDGRFLTDMPGATGAAGFSPDSRYAMTLSNDGLALRDPETLKPIKTLASGDEVPLRVESRATFLNKKHYRVEGTFTFADAAPVSFTGQVRDVFKYPGAPSSPIVDELEVRFRYRDTAWFWRARQEERDGRPAWSGLLEMATGTTSNPTYYDLVLEPTQ